MALTVSQGFTKFLDLLTPTEAARAASARHRTSVETSLRNALEVRRFREIGSFGHGTGVRGHYDVDLLVSLKSKPGSSDTALNWVKKSLSDSFPTTTVKIRRPAVVIDFAGGNERWEVVPGFLTNRGGQEVYVYDIPGSDTGWIDTAPAEHLNYVTEVNQIAKILGGAKKLSRLAKAWKYFNSVPVSSFYLEMRAAKWLSTEASFSPPYDICLFLEYLKDINLAAMNDPKGAAGRFYPCSTQAKAQEAASKVDSGASRARTALNYYLAGNENKAFEYYDLLFGHRFPSR